MHDPHELRTRKAVPVLLRHHCTEVLAFHHPLAGVQLVKGTIERGETDEAAAKRELLEESGVSCTSLAYLATSDTLVHGQEWVFYKGAGEGLPERWTHHCADDGGHKFQFFWHPLATEPKGSHPVFEKVFQHLRAWLL